MAGRKRKNNAEYFSHDSGMRNDEKVKVLRSKFGVDGYAFWCMFLEVLCDKESFAFERTDISIMILSGDTGFDENSINEMLDYIIKLKMLQCDKNLIYSQNMIERFEPLLSKRVKMRTAYQAHVDKQKSISEAEINNSEAEINNSEAEKANSENFCDSQTSEIPQRKGKDSIVKDSNNKKTYVENSEEFRLAKLLSDLILGNNSENKASIKAQQNNYQSWSDTIRLINKIDNRSFQQIEYLINWTQKDEFWHKNILSPSKLRSQFDQLALKVTDLKQNKATSLYDSFSQDVVNNGNPELKQIG